ncbi:MAG: hypothetical protein HY262_07750 [Chloroflexi bacterium]|nr:hypothetical protein [Chloroflexota bacterium]
MRLTAIVAAVMLAVLAPAGVDATPPCGVPALSVTIDVSSRSCQTVRVDYRVEWQGMTPDAAGGPVTVELLATPGDYFLTSASLDAGHKADKAKGKVRDELIRESGFFDHQTYPGLAYQIVVRAGAMEARSTEVAIPECVPMAPTEGPAAGGTVVTVTGGGTFGGDPFTMATLITVGETSDVTPIGVGADGSWLQFVTPAGPSGTCVAVFTQSPGLPFPLPPFCYGA